MRVVTTVHREGWEQYGKKALKRWRVHWPKSAELWHYAEGFEVPPTQRVVCRNVDELPLLARFKRTHERYRVPDWRYDVVRFANKAYAAYDALRDYDGIGVWLDADIVTVEDVPEGYVEGLLPDDCYIALFRRTGAAPETGLWVANCAHPMHKPVMDAFLSWYEQATFKGAHEWHDAVLFEATLRAFENKGLINVHSLSAEHASASHPMALHESRKYWDHLKGPRRKALGHSPERVVE